MHFVADTGAKHPLQLKAVNAKAKEAQAAENKAAAARAQPKIQSARPEYAQQKDTWLVELQPKKQIAATSLTSQNTE